MEFFTLLFNHEGWAIGAAIIVTSVGATVSASHFLITKVDLHKKRQEQIIDNLK